MFRRWLIRSLALTLLTLCAAAWVGSYFRGIKILVLSGTHVWEPGLAGGELNLVYGHHDPIASSVWEVTCWKYDSDTRSATRARYEGATYHFLGFGWRSGTLTNYHLLMIPLWFPTLLSALLLALVWRKTRTKIIGRGYPVEPAPKAKGL
jgi:hypothetical protein